MNFSFSEEQSLLRESISKFLQNNYDFETKRKIASSNSGFSKEYWQQFAELGWLSIPFSEEQGGFGGSAVDTMIVMEELGKALVLEPYLATVILAGKLLSASTDDAMQNHIDSIIAGDTLATFAYLERNTRSNITCIEATLQQSGDQYILNGVKDVVLHGESADLILVLARSSGLPGDQEGLTLVLLDATQEGVNSKGYKLMDGTPAAQLHFEQVTVSKTQLIGEPGKAFAIVDPVIQHAIIAISSEALGAMEVLYKATVEYTKTRKQFGVPISQFQALQHRMVDMFIEYEQTKSLLYRAVMSFDKNDSDAAKNIAALKVKIGESGTYIAQESIQLHGGMGLTDELFIGYYLKKLLFINQLFGTADYHKDRFIKMAS